MNVLVFCDASAAAVAVAQADSITAHLQRLNTMAARLNTAQRAWVESKAKIVPAMRKRTDNEFKTHQRVRKPARLA